MRRRLTAGKLFRVRALRTFSGSLSMSARSGRKPRAATLGPLAYKGSVFIARRVSFCVPT
jgi:hypothetical protein